MAKGLDLYVRDIFIDDWNSVQADTQYQGEGSSHELASLLITEVIQHSKYTSLMPIFLLFLDAESAFDKVVIPYLIRSFYMAGMEGHSALYMENRLASRITFCEFDKCAAGPIHDEQGLEQGGVSSSDSYKIYNNELLTVAQTSCLGVELSNSLTVSAVGQADDVALLSNNLGSLDLLFHLTKEYCTKYNVKLSSSKTKLMVISPPNKPSIVCYNQAW